MFKNCKKFFCGEASLEVDQTGEQTGSDLLIATIVILSEVGGSNLDFTPQERAEIFKALSRDFMIQDEEAGELFQIAEFIRREKGDGKVAEFIEAINKHFNDVQRARVLTLAWKIVLADGVVEESEATMVSELRKHLNLTMEQAVRAQAVAQTELAESAES